MKLTDLKSGNCVWIDDFGTHPGVVMHVDEKSAIVIRGSHVSRPHLNEVCVRESSPAGRAMNLSTATYFNATRYSVINDASKIVKKTGKNCPFDTFARLEALIRPLVMKATALLEAQQQQLQQREATTTTSTTKAELPGQDAQSVSAKSPDPTDPDPRAK